jgi:hypothetical protein
LKKQNLKSMFIGFFLLSCIVFCAASCSASGWSGPIELTHEKEAYLKRFLHPLPQELRFKGVGYRIPYDECVLVSSPTTAMEKQIIDDFKARWTRRTGKALGNVAGRLVIRVGLNDTGSTMFEDLPLGLVDTKYLAERPNPEQAYTIVTEAASEGGVTVAITANAMPGLYYGLLTFDQLVTPLSEEDTLVLPHVDCVDWPDVRLRGTWTLLHHEGTDDKALKTYDDTLRRFSHNKLNLAEAWHINVLNPKDNGPISAAWIFPKTVIEMGKRYAVEVLPGTGHLPKKFRSEALRRRFPGAPGIQRKKERKTLHLCQNDPDTRDFYTQYLTSVARQYDLADVWMSEIEGPRGVCHCHRCKGDTQQAFVLETKNLMDAYGAARTVNPSFKMTLGLTQGSYPHHFSMLEHIPKDVILNFYNGKMTYKADFQRYNLPPSVMEFQRLGYTVGSTPSPIDTQMMIPFQTPQYCRLLCGEADDRHLDFMLAQLWPDHFANDFNAQALAEFLWNSSGRSAEAFTVAWATRKGWDNPEEAAAIILMLEYPSRGLHNARVKNIVGEIVDYFEGKSWRRKVAGHVRNEAWTNRSVLGKLEYPTRHEMARIRSLCEQAVERAERLGNMELLAASRVLKHWAIILDQYALCMDNPDAETKKTAMAQIRTELKSLPLAHSQWLAHKNLSDYAKRHTRLWFEQQQQQWASILTDK